MSAPAFGTIGTKYGATTTAPAPAVPASVASGDIIAVYMFVDQTATVSAMPTGFAQATASPRAISGGAESFGLNVMWKRATGGDTGTYSFTISASAFVYAYAVRYTGCVSSGSPWDTATSADNGSSQGTSCPAVSLTTLGPDRLITYCGMDWNGDGGTWTVPTGYNQRAGGASVANLEISDLVQATAGSTGNVNATNNSTGTVASWLGALIGTTVSNTVSPAIVIPTTAVHRAYSW